MEPMTDEQKVAQVRRYLPEEDRYVFTQSYILGVARRLGDDWHLAVFPRQVANHLRGIRYRATR